MSVAAVSFLKNNILFTLAPTHAPDWTVSEYAKVGALLHTVIKSSESGVHDRQANWERLV